MLLFKRSNKKQSSLFSVDEKYTIPVSDSLALRIYSDTSPHNWKIASLQKGLILTYRGREIVGAGAGFGFPTLVCSNELNFSSSARVRIFQQGKATVIQKEFFIDRIKRNRFQRATLESLKARNMLDIAAILCRKYFRVLRLKDLLIRFGVRTEFMSIPNVGFVTMTYVIDRGLVRVKADFAHVKKKVLKAILLLNEQSSRFFRVPSDSNGSKLVDAEIGHWGIVRADHASITDIDCKIGFRLRQMENSTLRKGQEYLNGFLDWVGLDYEINPNCLAFEYAIEIMEG